MIKAVQVVYLFSVANGNGYGGSLAVQNTVGDSSSRRALRVRTMLMNQVDDSLIHASHLGRRSMSLTGTVTSLLRIDKYLPRRNSPLR